LCGGGCSPKQVEEAEQEGQAKHDGCGPDVCDEAEWGYRSGVDGVSWEEKDREQSEEELDGQEGRDAE
jgi:hypothetical protein